MATYPPSHHASAARLLPEFTPLGGDQRYDVAIVGAGYTSLSAALHLAQLGYKVCVLEAQRVGWGASGRNGGQLGIAMVELQPQLIALYGEQRARQLWDISIDALELFHSLCAEYQIECDFRVGNMACAATPADLNNLLDHVLIVEGYGSHVYTSYDRDSLSNICGSPRYYGAINTNRAGHLNPLKYCLGLAQAAVTAGVTIHEMSPVEKICFGDPLKMICPDGSVTANYGILGCNGYLGKLNKAMAGRILPVENYQAATAVLDDETLSNLINGDMCIWDTSRSVHFFRKTPDGRLTMGCGIGIPGYPPRNLRSECARHLEFVYPQLAGVELDFVWGGNLAGTRSHMPDVGTLAPNLYYAQGYTGHGLALAPMVGKYLAQAIQDESPEFELLAGIPQRRVPGGTALRIPAVLAYRFTTNTLDRLDRSWAK